MLTYKGSKCPICGSLNTFTCNSSVKLYQYYCSGTSSDKDKNDYLLIRHKCKDCEHKYSTKAKVNILYTEDSEDIIMSEYESLRNNLHSEFPDYDD